MFVEGAGNEEQPTNTYPEIAKRTVLRRNGLSVFHLFPCHRLNNSFESCCQKSFKTVDPSERSEETSPDISYKIISRGHHTNFPFQNSSSSTQTSSPHTPIFPIITQYPEELGGRGEKQNPVRARQGCYCTWQSSGRRDRNPKGRCRGRDVLWAALQGALTCPSNPGAIPEPRAPRQR